MNIWICRCPDGDPGCGRNGPGERDDCGAQRGEIGEVFGERRMLQIVPVGLSGLASLQPVRGAAQCDDLNPTGAPDEVHSTVEAAEVV